MITLLKRQSQQQPQQILTQQLIQTQQESTIYNKNSQSQSVATINSSQIQMVKKTLPWKISTNSCKNREQERQHDLSVAFQENSQETNMSQQKISDLES